MKHLFIFLVVICVSLLVGINALHPAMPQLSFGTFSLDTPKVLGEATSTQPIKNSIRFVGDIMLGRDVETKIQEFGSTYPLSSLTPNPTDAYLVGNFEAAIPEEHVHTPNMQFDLAVDKDYVHALSQFGFTHLGLSNNHSYDFGLSSYEHTVSVLTDASTTPFGDPENQASSSIPVVIMGSSTRVALIPLYAVVDDPTDAQIASLFAQANAISDMQVVFIHWGTEYQKTHSIKQEQLAHKLIDAGADVIIGHHPHVVEDIGMYKNVPIFYSLGNFIFDQYFSDDVQNGLMVAMQKGTSTLQFSLLPVSSINSPCSPYFMNASVKEKFLSELAQKSAQSLRAMIEKGSLTTALPQ